MFYLDGIKAAFRLILDHAEIGGVHPKVGPAVRSYAIQRRGIGALSGWLRHLQ